MRCTSTPRTPEPSPRPKAAMARRARSLQRVVGSVSERGGDLLSERVEVDVAVVGSVRPGASVMFLRAAWASVARKKKRSNTSSKILRSSFDLASVAASASLKSRCSVQSTWCERLEGVEDLGGSDRHALGSEVLGEGEELAVERAGRMLGDAAVDRLARALGGGIGLLERDADTGRHRVQVGAVLDDHAHRVDERVVVDVAGAEQQQRARPVDRLGDAGRLLEVELADLVDDLGQLPGDRLVELGGVEADDLELVLEVRVVEPEVEAAALEGLGELAGVVRGEQDDGSRLGLDPAELGDARSGSRRAARAAWPRTPGRSCRSRR